MPAPTPRGVSASRAGTRTRAAPNAPSPTGAARRRGRERAPVRSSSSARDVTLRPMVRPLTLADTADARSLLRARPLRNVFLDYVVSAGALGRAPGFLGFESGGRLVGILLIGPLGGTALEVQDPAAYAPLADAAARAALRPRHIVGSEDVTEPFWREYERHAPALRWSRREPVFAMRAEDLARTDDGSRLARVDPARPGDADEITANSAQ